MGNRRTFIFGLISCSILVTLSPIGAASQQGSAPKLQAEQLVKATIPSVANQSLHFKLLRLRLPADKTAEYALAKGLVYEVSGTQTVSTSDKNQKLRPGQGMYIDGKKPATFQTSAGQPAVFLYFALVPPGKLESRQKVGPATITKNYHTAESLPGLKIGTYAFSLTRLKFPPEFPRNARHYRTGGALYYVISGTGQFTSGGKTNAKPAGRIIYEPYGLVHQWGNPADKPVTIIVANISPEGEPAVKSGAPADSK